MNSILARSYPISAMVPNLLPAQPAGNSTKAPAPKTDTAIPTDAAPQLSARVSAFLTSDAAMETSGRRPKGTPPEGGLPPAGAGPRQSETSSESETALLLLETDDETDSDDSAADTGSQNAAIVFDEAATYYPTSLY
ncbi:hypothetical protein [Hoeflea sp.]|uniref:hypothetical protein n=1 Tax=Hoeflea sp. TaxID=1940281 RepID=UPI0025C2321B|nr:hypothetical protein [Hoeflea sp.]